MPLEPIFVASSSGIVRYPHPTHPTSTPPHPPHLHPTPPTPAPTPSGCCGGAGVGVGWGGWWGSAFRRTIPSTYSETVPYPQPQPPPPQLPAFLRSADNPQLFWIQYGVLTMHRNGLGTSHSQPRDSIRMPTVSVRQLPVHQIQPAEVVFRYWDGPKAFRISAGQRAVPAEDRKRSGWVPGRLSHPGQCPISRVCGQM